MTLVRKTALVLSIQAALVAPMQLQAADTDDSKLEVITVSALKRTQSAQDVPVSIATLSGEKFDNIFSGGDDILSLSSRVPGLYAESSNGRAAPRFYMRGLGNSDFDLAASQPVSIIMDDVVLENVVLKSFPLFDVDQVEIIRGPQGSLFGRNTTAGIIKFNTRRPTDDFDAYVKASAGNFGLLNFEGAAGGAITNDLSGRISVFSNSKDDWIDNGFTGENDALGGFEDQAYRIQLAYNPTEELDILFNYHARSLDGTSSVMRANVLSTGSNKLNQNYDRDRVYYDGGNNNPQEYDGDGWSLNVNYDFGAFTLTSITAAENADGGGMGDIDGGVGDTSSVAPDGLRTPFNSATQDSADVEQFTQELRLASNDDGDFTWQTGLFYFDSELTVITDPGFVDPSTVKQTNTTWAVFGQGTYSLDDQTSVIAGVRYTDDEKGLTGFSGGLNSAVDPVDVSDSQVSWEAMINHKYEDDVSVYARVANGFRAQSIQGRDIAFLGAPSVAESETIMSYEAGFKSNLLDRTLRLNGAIFYYTIDDIQLTAVGGEGNNVGLRNAGEGVGQGFELDAEYRANENLTFTAGFSYNDTELKDPDLLISPCGSGACTVLDPIDAETGAAIVNGNPFPNAPETILTLTGRYSVPIGNNGEVYFYGDYARQGKTNIFIYEAEEFKTDNQFELGLRVGYIDYNNDYEVALFGRNITDEDNVKAAVDFNNNTAIVNEPATFGIEFKKNFY